MYNYQCLKCQEWCLTSKSDRTICKNCTDKKKLRCQNCNKSFSSITGKVNCRTCRRILGQLKHSVRIKNICQEAMTYETDIKLLSVKLKHNLLSPVDVFRIASIYVEITCDPLKYSNLTIDNQCRLMIDDLVMIMKGNLKVRSIHSSLGKGRSKPVEQLNKSGKVIAEFNCLREASEVLGLTKNTIRNICERKRKSRIFFFRWKQKF